MITDEMRAAIGVEGEPTVLEVTTTDVRLFARAVGHTDLIFFDEAVAKARGYRNLVAPPGYLGTPVYRPGNHAKQTQHAPARRFDIPYRRVLDAGTEVEYFEPVVVGDVITCRAKVTGFQERDGSIGPMLITSRETVYTRQDGAVVAKMRGSLIHY